MNVQPRPGADLIWQSGVVRSGKGRVWLEFDDPGACNRCHQGTGCGAALFSRLFRWPSVVIPLRERGTLQPGQRVHAGLNPRWLMMAAAALYLLPVLSFLGGALAAHAIWPRNDAAALGGAVLVTFLAMQAIRTRLHSRGPPELALVPADGPLESGGAGDQLPLHIK